MPEPCHDKGKKKVHFEVLIRLEITFDIPCKRRHKDVFLCASVYSSAHPYSGFLTETEKNCDIAIAT